MAQSVLMLSKRKAQENAEKEIISFKSEREMTKHMSETMISHPIFRCGYEHRIDRMALDTDVKGLVDKFKIHGYEDRGERLNYLQYVLRHKLSEKPGTFQIVMRFLMELSESPTNVLNVQIDKRMYSHEPDREVSKAKYDDLDILSDTISDGEQNRLELHYSSESDLSDWQISDSEDSAHSEPLEPFKCIIRQSRSFSEFSHIAEKGADEKRKERECFWKKEGDNAKEYLSSQIRKVELVPLKSQPVIRTLLDLHSKFGEYLEWKKMRSGHPTTYIILIEDIIREILWQFSHPDPRNSVVFTENWHLKSELMVSSLSKLALSNFLKKYGMVLENLQDLQKFASDVKNSSIYFGIGDGGERNQPPKVYKVYAHCLSEFFTYITSSVASIEKYMKKDCWKEGDPQPSTTLIQMDRQLDKCNQLIKTVKNFHDQSVESWPNDSNQIGSVQWFCSVKVLSSLEMYLNFLIQPMDYGIICFFYTKCLRAFFEEIVNALDTLNWNSLDSCFLRDGTVNLQDSSFWRNSITLKPYLEKLEEIKLAPMLCMQKLMPKVLTILKTLELYKQLGEDHKKFMGKLPTAQDAVNELLLQLFPEEDYTEPECSTKVVDEAKAVIDYASHIKFLGLEGALVTNAFRFILEKQPSQIKKKNGTKMHKFSLKYFVNLNEVSGIPHGAILDNIVTRWIRPYYQKSQEAVRNMFTKYSMKENLEMFREIILGGREDFAKAVGQISIDKDISTKFYYEDPLSRNLRFQQLLDECYPEGREHFQIDFLVDPHHHYQYNFTVTLSPPFNIVLSLKCIRSYLYISDQLQQVRNSLWRMTTLSMAECKPGPTVGLNRALILRFALIHYCSSIRAFLLFKMFNINFSLCPKNGEGVIDGILEMHEEYLNKLETNLFKHPLFEKIIMKQMVQMTRVISDCWAKNIPVKTVILIEDTLKKCWAVFGSDTRTNMVDAGVDFSDLAHHLGPPPNFL